LPQSRIARASGQRPIPSRPYAIGLWLLLGLFALRVAAQPLSLVDRLGVLPTFESWHSAALPYGLLLSTQLAILVALATTAYRFTVGAVTPQRSRGALALTLGGMYFVGMLARLVLGLTALGHLRWFASPLPTIFHLVLATWVLLYGRFHWVYGEERAPGR
jgi:hypothetical protein